MLTLALCDRFAGLCRGRSYVNRTILSCVFNSGHDSVFFYLFASSESMSWKFGFVVFFFFFGSAWSVEDNPAAVPTNQNEESKLFQEIECSRAGGICLARESCPPEKISQEGQCPKQQNLGAVCCHSLSATETRCQQLGGHCRESCAEDIIISRAIDCPEGEKCCTLV